MVQTGLAGAIWERVTSSQCGKRGRHEPEVKPHGQRTALVRRPGWGWG